MAADEQPSLRRVHPAKQGSDVRHLGVESYRGVLLHNWSREVRFRPELAFFPKTPAEVVTIVEAADALGKRITLMGKGCSWSPLMAGSGYLICTTDMNRIVDVDPRRGLVTVEAGATIADVDAALARHGLSLPGSIVGTTDITLGGLIATGSHGSWRDCPPVSDLMVAADLVEPSGEPRRFSDEESGKAVMDALRLNLGLFGVMTRVTLRTMPSFDVLVVDRRVPLCAVFERLPELLERHQSVEVLWFPFAEHVTIKTWSETHAARRKRSITEAAWAKLQRRLGYVVFDKYISRKLVRDPAATPRLMRRFSPLIFPSRTYVTDVTSAVHYVDDATLFPIKEFEIALPMDGPSALADVQLAWDALIDTVLTDAKHGRYALNVIIHLRFTAGSTAYMSPAYGNRSTAWLDFGSYHASPGWKELVGRVWSRLRHLRGVRLHWAKDMLGCPDLDLRAMYGQTNVDTFLEQRARFDPKGLFAHDLARRLFGLEDPRADQDPP